MKAMHAGQRHGVTGRSNAGTAAQNRIRLLAFAGIIGPVLFTVTFLVQELLRAGEFDPVAETVSALAAGRNGWVQQLNFIVFGLLTIACAFGLHLGIAPSKAGVAGPALVLVSGVGLLIAAAFPLREDESGDTYDPGGHAVAGVTFFLSSAAALVVLSRRLAHDPRWRSLAAYTLTAGALGLAGFILMGVLVIPDGAPLHEWAGLLQRIIVLAILFPCRLILAFNLLRITRDT